MRVEDVRDERVDGEVRRRRGVARVRARAQHRLEEVETHYDHGATTAPTAASGHEERRTAEMPAVREHEHEGAAREPEERAPRERRELDDEQERESDGERRLQPVPALEAQVHRRQDEERDHELDAEMVRVAGERVHAEDLLRAADGAEDVDPGLPRRDRLDEDLVEVRAGLGEHELDDAVDGVQRDAAAERRQRVPVEARRPPAEQRDPGDEEPEVEDELHHPLPPLRERLARVEVVEADEVEEGEREEERERDHAVRPKRPSLRPMRSHAKSDEEDGREDVRERQRAREAPLQLVERDGEDRQQEEAVEQAVLDSAVEHGRASA